MGSHPRGSHEKITAYKAKVGFWLLALLADGRMLVETGLDGSVWNFPAGNRNPGLNRDGPDGFLAGFWGGRRPTYRGGLGGGAVAPPAKPRSAA